MGEPTPQQVAGSTNVVVLRGSVTSDFSQRELAGGEVVAQFDLTTRIDADNGHVTNISVPLAWHDPTESDLAAVVIGAPVVVVGTVRRRFFRSGGSTQSRTEVIVDRLIPATRTKSVRSLLAATASDLSRAAG